MKGYDLKGEKDTAKEQRIPPRHGTFGEKIPPRHGTFGKKIPPQHGTFGERIPPQGEMYHGKHGTFHERYQGKATKVPSFLVPLDRVKLWPPSVDDIRIEKCRQDLTCRHFLLVFVLFYDMQLVTPREAAIAVKIVLSEIQFSRFLSS